MTSPFILERAKALANVDWGGPSLDHTWRSIPSHAQDKYIAMAEAIMADFKKRGWKVMEREPTEKMVDALCTRFQNYEPVKRWLEGAFDAAPDWPEGEKS